MAPKRLTVLLAAMAISLVAMTAVACGGDATESANSVVPAGDGDRRTDFAGYVRSPATDVSDVVLPDANGEPVTMVARTDGLRLAFFGYTTCPDVCPATLGYIKMAMSSLTDADRARLDVDMITVDPSRDDGATMTRYVEQFIPEANALRTDDDQILRSAANAFGAGYDVSTDDAGEIQVSHTGDLYAVDDSGIIVLAWPFGTSPADIETDLQRLLEGDRPTPHL